MGNGAAVIDPAVVDKLLKDEVFETLKAHCKVKWILKDVAQVAFDDHSEDIEAYWDLVLLKMGDKKVSIRGFICVRVRGTVIESTRSSSNR